MEMALILLPDISLAWFDFSKVKVINEVRSYQGQGQVGGGPSTERHSSFIRVVRFVSRCMGIGLFYFQ